MTNLAQMRIAYDCWQDYCDAVDRLTNKGFDWSSSAAVDSLYGQYLRNQSPEIALQRLKILEPAFENMIADNVEETRLYFWLETALSAAAVTFLIGMIVIAVILVGSH